MKHVLTITRQNVTEFGSCVHIFVADVEIVFSVHAPVEFWHRLVLKPRSWFERVMFLHDCSLAQTYTLHFHLFVFIHVKLSNKLYQSKK